MWRKCYGIIAAVFWEVGREEIQVIPPIVITLQSTHWDDHREPSEPEQAFIELRKQ